MESQCCESCGQTMTEEELAISQAVDNKITHDLWQRFSEFSQALDRFRTEHGDIAAVVERLFKDSTNPLRFRLQNKVAFFSLLADELAEDIWEAGCGAL